MRALSVIFVLLTLLSGCGGSQTEADDISGIIAGRWVINYAVNADDGTELPLQLLYGSAIILGDGLTLYSDGSFTKYYGVTDDISKQEGSYSVDGNTIIFVYDYGNTETALYLPSSREIEYHCYPLEDEAVYEYYTKAE